MKHVGGSNSLVMDRANLHGIVGDRHGVLRCLDVHMVRGGPMREAIIIGTILILAVLIWRPRKGGRQ